MSRKVNLIGRRFGKGVVIECTERRRQGGIVWKLKCDCGEFYYAVTRLLKFGNVKSCGCLVSPDLTGMKFGRGIVLEELSERDADGKKFWLLKCLCDNEYKATTQRLNKGATRSCGCLRYSNDCGDISGSFFSQIRKNAFERKIEFNLSVEFLWNLFLKQNKKCALSGVELVICKTYKEHYSGITTASLDRIDCKKGYVSDNVQWVHKLVNLMKQKMNNDELFQWCLLIVNKKLDKIYVG